MRSLMEQIVQHEQPIRVEVLFKLITRAHALQECREAGSTELLGEDLEKQ